MRVIVSLCRARAAGAAVLYAVECSCTQFCFHRKLPFVRLTLGSGLADTMQLYAILFSPEITFCEIDTRLWTSSHNAAVRSSVFIGNYLSCDRHSTLHSPIHWTRYSIWSCQPHHASPRSVRVTVFVTPLCLSVRACVPCNLFSARKLKGNKLEMQRSREPDSTHTPCHKRWLAVFHHLSSHPLYNPVTIIATHRGYPSTPAIVQRSPAPSFVRKVGRIHHVGVLPDADTPV